MDNLKDAIFAHHPTCDHFSDHWFELHNYKICKGCFVMYLGFFIGIIFELIFLDYFTQLIRIIGGIALFVLNIIYFVIDERRMRLFLRFLLGLAISFLISFVYFQESFLHKFIGILIFITVIYFYSVFRHRSSSFCSECDNFNP